MKEKTNFYLFLDIDGVMSDWDYIISEVEAGRLKRGQSIKTFKPESVEALNYLITEISKDYNFKLVISSTWRIDMEETKDVFKKHNILCSDELDKTPRFFNPKHRSKEILQYLKEHNFNKDKDDFVIIDDETFDFGKYFPPEKFIKTEIYHNALSMDMVKKYLEEKQKSVDSAYAMQ